MFLTGVMTDVEDFSLKSDSSDVDPPGPSLMIATIINICTPTYYEHYVYYVNSIYFNIITLRQLMMID